MTTTRARRHPYESDETVADPLALFNSEFDVPPRTRPAARPPARPVATPAVTPRVVSRPSSRLRPLLVLTVVATVILVTLTLLSREAGTRERPRAVEPPPPPPALATELAAAVPAPPDGVPPVVASDLSAVPTPANEEAVTQVRSETPRVIPAVGRRPLARDVVRPGGRAGEVMTTGTPSPAPSPLPTVGTSPASVVPESSPPRPDVPLHVEAERVPAPPRETTDRERIQTLLDAYTAAYERFDTVSAASLWPGVDARALSRAFSSLSRQDVSFDRCDITVAGTQATARCNGAIEYVRRVGDTTPQSRSTAWVFGLDRRGSEWRITDVTAR